MRGPSLSIGRGETNDVVLPDPDRLVSKTHCVIEDRGGSIVILDYSTNGTFLNYGKVPLGKTPNPLNNGDILTVGSYELLVEVSQGAPDPLADLPPPLEDEPLPTGQNRIPDDLDGVLGSGPDRDFLDDLIGGAKPVGPAGVQRSEIGEDGLLPPLGEDGLGRPDHGTPQGASQYDHSPSVNDPMPSPVLVDKIPEDWGDDLMAAGSSASPPLIPEDDDWDAPPGTPAPKPVPQTTPTAAGGQEAARAFLEALGVSNADIPDEDLPKTMASLGDVFRVLVSGTQDVLRTRTSIKSEFRIAQTMIAPRGNNPLKFSANPDEAIQSMVKPSAAGYLEGSVAARQAMDDIRSHEVAMMTGMEAAMKGLLARFSPETLEAKIQSGGGIGDALKGKKARYWEAFEAMYAEISDQAENEFHELFSKEFAKAYQDQMERLKKP
jgi:type VI secretion system protein ImpI/type VI secretion system protein